MVEALLDACPYKALAYCDGACKQNNIKSKTRPGGWGAFIIYKEESRYTRWITYGGKKGTTNQEMELTAMDEVLKLIEPGDDVMIRSDSLYVLNGIGDVTKSMLGHTTFSGWIGGWEKKNWKKADGKSILNIELWKSIYSRCLFLVKNNAVLHFEHVAGHSGEPGNEMADKLSNLGVPL
jgi:ribonuclease HI